MSKLFFDMVGSLGSGKQAAENVKAFFGPEEVRSYSVASLRSLVVAEYIGAAFFQWVKLQPKWRVAAVYMIDEGKRLLIAKAANGEVLGLIAEQSVGGWRFVADPSQYSIWPLVQNQSFLKAINGL